MPRCPSCLETVPRLDGDCPACGATLRPPCVGCGGPVRPGVWVCGGCGEAHPPARPGAEAPCSAATLLDGAAWRHPREAAAFSEYVEGLPRGAPARPAPPAPAGVPDRPLRGVVAARLAAVGLPPGAWVAAAGAVRVQEGRLVVGRNLSCALDEGELGFLALVAAFPRGNGSGRLPGFPDGPRLGDPAARRRARSYRRKSLFSADRLAAVATGLGLPAIGRALFKSAALAPPDGFRGALARLGEFRPGEDFRAYRRLLEPFPQELERCWELMAFLKGERYRALRDLVAEVWSAPVVGPALEAGRATDGGSGTDSGSGTDGRSESAARPAASPVAPAASVAAAPRAPSGVPSPDAAAPGTAASAEPAAPTTTVAIARAPRLDVVPLHRPRPAAPAVHEAGESLVVLSGYHRDLRFAGPGGGRARRDLAAHLRMPSRLASAPDGGLWVADGGTGRLLKLGATGEAEVRLEGGPRRPGPMAVDPKGRLFVGDPRTGRVRLLAPDGRELREFGAAVPGGLGAVSGLAIGPRGDLWVSDRAGGRLLWLDPEGGLRREFGGGPGAIAARPGALVADGEHGVWVVDEATRRLRRVGPVGVVRGEVPLAGHDLTDARLARGAGGLVLLEPAAGRLLRLGPGGEGRAELAGLVAPEDGQGYCADLVISPRSQVLSAAAPAPAAAPRRREPPCAQAM